MSPQQGEEERSADETGDDAHRQLRRRKRDPRQEIGADQERGAGECRGGYQTRVGRAEHGANEVWRDEPDESDEPGQRHSRGREQSRRRQDQALGAFDIDAETGRDVVTEREGVEAVRHRECDREGGADECSGHGELRPADHGHAADEKAEQRREMQLETIAGDLNQRDQ